MGDLRRTSTAEPHPGRTWRFDGCVLDEAERRLVVDGVAVSLSPKAFDVLVALVERNGRLVRRQELMDLLWPDTYVEDGTLARHISYARRALGASAAALETVPKAGYRFNAVIDEAPGEEERAPTVEVTTPAVTTRRAGTGVAAAVLLVATVGWLVSSRRAPDRLVAPPRSVAVLPFTAIGESRGQEHLEIGLADVLITRLSQIPELEVRPLGAVSQLAGTSPEPLAVGRSLGVDAVLEGTLRRREGRLRVSARLLAVADGRALWAGSFDHADRDLTAVEEAIGREAALSLTPSLRSAAGTPKGRAPSDAEAHDLYLQGRYFWAKRTSEGHRRAVGLFDAALARDPDYSDAESGLAAAYALLAGVAEPPALYEEARRHAARALVLDPSSADAHVVLGLVATNYDADWALAAQEYQLALALQPNHPTAHHWFGEMLALLGRTDEGIALLERALRLDPVSLAIRTDLAKAHYFARRFDEAVARGEEALAMDSQYAWAWAWVGTAELQRGNADRALECLTRFADLESSPFAAAVRIWGLVAVGRADEAAAAHGAIEASARDGYVMPVALAMARLAEEDEDGALDALEELVAAHQNRLGVSTTPLFDPLRDQPRFHKLMLRAGLPPPSVETPMRPPT